MFNRLNGFGAKQPPAADAEDILFSHSYAQDSDSVTLPASLATGDLGILFDGGRFGNGYTTVVTPTGWTSAGNAIEDGGKETLINVSYKILSASDSSTTVTGYTSSDYDGQNGKHLIVLRTSGGVSSVTVQGVQTEGTAANPAAQTVAAGGGTPELIILCGHTARGVSSRVANLTVTDAYDYAYHGGSYYTCAAGYKYYSASPSNFTADCPDDGSGNTLISMYLEVS